MAEEANTRLLPDPQDPLPEANWLWRRVFVFVALAATFAILIGLGLATNRIVGNVVNRIDSMDARTVGQIAVVALNVMQRMFTLLFYLAVLIVTYYMVAPSAEQITKMIQTAGLLKHGVQVAARAAAQVEGRREETQATIGLPPQPVVPPETPQERDSGPGGTADTPEAPVSLPDAPWAKDGAKP